MLRQQLHRLAGKPAFAGAPGQQMETDLWQRRQTVRLRQRAHARRQRRFVEAGYAQTCGYRRLQACHTGGDVRHCMRHAAACEQAGGEPVQRAGIGQRQ